MATFSHFRRRVGAWLGGFEGAAGHRRLRGFTPSRAHVNVLLAQAGPEMRARARFLVCNNGYAANAVESWAANAVGDGIKPQSLIKAARTKEKLQRLWLDWTDEADAEGLTDFYGIQRRIARELCGLTCALSQSASCLVNSRAEILQADAMRSQRLTRTS